MTPSAWLLGLAVFDAMTTWWMQGLRRDGEFVASGIFPASTLNLRGGTWRGRRGRGTEYASMRKVTLSKPRRCVIKLAVSVEID